MSSKVDFSVSVTPFVRQSMSEPTPVQRSREHNKESMAKGILSLNLAISLSERDLVRTVVT